MFKLFKGGICFKPENIGIKDILVVNDKIVKIDNRIVLLNQNIDLEIIDCTEKAICPGFIDQHVHISGGGGENGPASIIPEISVSDLTKAGITTVVGILGFDGINKSVAALVSKAKKLEIEGISAFAYTGSYDVPPITLTGDVMRDIVFIEKIIGIGEIAISDYRSSVPSARELARLAREVIKAGMLSGKAGVIHVHLGDEETYLDPLVNVFKYAEFNLDSFVPTHINRNKGLFDEGIKYAKKGGRIDLTSGISTGVGYNVPDALEILLNKSVNIENITVSSDSNGSIGMKNKEYQLISKPIDLLNDIRVSILEKRLGIEQVLKAVTSNVAKLLKIYPQKGTIQAGSDADIMIFDLKTFNINKLFAKGRLVYYDGQKD